MLPIMGGMIYGALWAYKKYQPGLAGMSREQDLRLVETLTMGTFGKLAVVEFSGQKILLSVTRGKIEPLARSHATNPSASAPIPPAALAESDLDIAPELDGRSA
ncbi:MAG: flagellar biosynthetic protein FliO [Blastomonas sp.]